MSPTTRDGANARVRVETVRLPEAPDPIGLFDAAERLGETRFLLTHPETGSALLGWGQAAVAVADDARALERALRDVELECVRDATPRFVGGLAFEPRSAAERAAHWRRFGNGRLWLPEFLLTWRDGRVELTRALRLDSDADADSLLAGHRQREVEFLSAKSEAGATRAAPSGPWPHPGDRYRASTGAAIGALRRGEAEKVVLADEVQRPWPAPFRSGPVLAALAATHPGCRTFGIGLGRRSFLGATPERLVKRRGAAVSTEAVAGTAPGGRSETARLGSPKEQLEHQLVVDALRNALAPLCEDFAVAPAAAFGTGSLQHLRTRIHGTLRQPTHVLELLSRIHPTPALGGSPRDAALELIARFENFDRGWYGGPIGWCDPSGDGDFFVALRCGLATTGDVRLYAGSGLMSESQADAEVRETALKLASFHRALTAA